MYYLKIPLSGSEYKSMVSEVFVALSCRSLNTSEHLKASSEKSFHISLTVLPLFLSVLLSLFTSIRF